MYSGRSNPGSFFQSSQFLLLWHVQVVDDDHLQSPGGFYFVGSCLLFCMAKLSWLLSESATQARVPQTHTKCKEFSDRGRLGPSTLRGGNPIWEECSQRGQTLCQVLAGQSLGSPKPPHTCLCRAPASWCLGLCLGHSSEHAGAIRSSKSLPAGGKRSLFAPDLTTLWLTLPFVPAAFSLNMVPFVIFHVCLSSP